MPGSRQPLLARRYVVLRSSSSFLHHAPYPCLVLNVILGECTAADEELGVLSERRGLLLDGLVHPWLGEARLVGFVVSITAIANDIDDNILLEFRTIVCGELAHRVHRLDVVTIDVEDGAVDGLCDVGGVGGGT